MFSDVGDPNRNRTGPEPFHQRSSLVGAPGGHVVRFTRMNIAPTILKNQIEDRLDIMDFRIVF
jgi:hypothetical protein